MQNIQLDLDCVFVEKTLQRCIDHHNTGQYRKRLLDRNATPANGHPRSAYRAAVD